MSWDISTAIVFIIIWDFLIFYQIFLSPQVIITYKHGIFKLPHELSNNAILSILEIEEISGKCLKSIEW